MCQAKTQPRSVDACFVNHDSKVCKDWAAVYKRNRSEFPDSNDILMASYLGLTTVVESIIETGELEAKSQSGRTPLS